MRKIYSLLLYLLTPLVVFRLIWLGFQNPGYWQRWFERFGWVSVVKGESPIWIHAVSVGEVQASTPIIKCLKKDFPQFPIILTTTTPTGADTVKRLFGNDVLHYYMPYDLPDVILRFLSRIQPRLLLTMETELWPNLFHYCSQQQIPVYVANARLSERSAKGYQRFSRLTRQLLSQISGIMAQNENDRQRFIELGAAPNQVSVTGSLKFDVSLPLGIHEQGEALRRLLGVNKPVWIAASTHAGEEELLLDVHKKLREQLQNLLLVLVPRHPERFDDVADLCQKKGFKTVRRSESIACDADSEVYLTDTMGELPICYAAADVAFVGGSLVPVGGHNVLEPAAVAIPTIIGPHIFNFSAIVDMLTQAGACFQVEDSQALFRQLSDLLNNADLRYQAGQLGLALVQENRGVVDKVMQTLEAELGPAT